jgi:hypothetical protein
MMDRDRDSKPVSYLVAEISVATGVPCIAIAKWVEKLYGSSEELTEQIKRLQSFYKYEKIIEIE